MNHQQWKEWVNLLAYEELDAERKNLTEDHLNACGHAVRNWNS